MVIVTTFAASLKTVLDVLELPVMHLTPNVFKRPYSKRDLNCLLTHLLDTFTSAIITKVSRVWMYESVYVSETRDRERERKQGRGRERPAHLPFPCVLSAASMYQSNLTQA